MLAPRRPWERWRVYRPREGVSEIMFIIKRSPIRMIPLTVLVLVALLWPSTGVLAQTVIATIPVGDSPNAVAVNLKTNRVYVGNAVSGTTSVINGRNNKVKKTITTGVLLFGTAVNSVTNRIYVTAGNDHIAVINGR